MPLVSVLMTSYNREKYIATAIESVLVSTYYRFELIIVDDASTDDTQKIIKKYATVDARIRLYINEQKIGDYANRNTAASYATGKYLKYVDSDDYIYPNALDIMVNSMEKFPEAGFGFCSLKQDIKKPFPFMLKPKEAYEYHFFGPGLFHNGPLAAIFKKYAFDKMNGFGTKRMISDIDMWHRMALIYPIVLMPDGLVWQRRHNEQELSSKHQFIYESEKIKWKYLDDPMCKLTIKQLTKIRIKRLKKYTFFILSGLKHGNIHQVKTYAKCFWFVLKINIKKVDG